MATLGTDLPLASDLAIVCSLIPVEDRCTIAFLGVVQMFLLLLHAGSALRAGTGPLCGGGRKAAGEGAQLLPLKKTYP
jgi:hypothetical protein